MPTWKGMQTTDKLERVNNQAASSFSFFFPPLNMLGREGIRFRSIPFGSSPNNKVGFVQMENPLLASLPDLTQCILYEVTLPGYFSNPSSHACAVLFVSVVF